MTRSGSKLDSAAAIRVLPPSVVSPLILALMMVLYNQKNLMGDSTASISTNIWMLIILLFTIAMAVAGIIGIAELF